MEEPHEFRFCQSENDLSVNRKLMGGLTILVINYSFLSFLGPEYSTIRSLGRYSVFNFGITVLWVCCIVCFLELVGHTVSVFMFHSTLSIIIVSVSEPIIISI